METLKEKLQAARDAAAWMETMPRMPWRKGDDAMTETFQTGIDAWREENPDIDEAMQAVLDEADQFGELDPVFWDLVANRFDIELSEESWMA